MCACQFHGGSAAHDESAGARGNRCKADRQSSSIHVQRGVITHAWLSTSDSTGIHPDRTSGGHRNHRGLDRLAAPGRSGGERGGRDAQCTNNLKQLGLAVHNYISSTNVLPAACMFTGPGVGSWSWCASWTTYLLPNMEQTPLYNATNFNYAMNYPPNTTVSYSKIAVLLCPSDAQKERPGSPWGPSNYVGNFGGALEIRMWTGTIVEPVSPVTPQTPSSQVGGQGVGVNWWYVMPDMAFFGVESISDGTSNTALFSEKLLGIPNTVPGGLYPYAGDTVNAKRGVFALSGMSVRTTTTIPGMSPWP